MVTNSSNSDFLKRLTEKLGTQIITSELSLNDAVVSIKRSDVATFFKILKLDTELSFNLLLDITVIDWLDSKDNRFEVVYHLLSMSKGQRLRVKVVVSEESPEIDSITSLWTGANFLEREAWDMYGVIFKGNPDLRRILMYDEFKGHPLRKDYPVQGKQPRVPLRSPEVENTARLMNRPELVQIKKKPGSKDGDLSGEGPQGRV